MAKFVGNVLWLVLCGFEMAVAWLFIGAFLAITVVGLPFGLQCFKLASFSLWPFGRAAVDDPNASRLGILGAVIWFVPGAFLAFGYVLSGLLLCLTVIGVPFGLQAFKLAGLAFAPFGKQIVST
ncbi:MAG: hypothetical protein RLZZ01_2421 [Actinomycetota bacterium]